MYTIFRKSYFPILLILILCFVVRLHQFSSPIGDWHSWRQADTSSVSRNFVKQGYDVLHPTFDDISNVASGLDNPNGYRFVEFPLFNVLQAGLFQLLGIMTLEQWGRVVSIISSVISAGVLYLLMKKYVSKEAGLLTAFFYAFLPFNIYYGRVILPDPTMVAASLLGIYFFDRWIEENYNVKNQKSKVQSKSQKLLFFILALLFTASAFLLKPYALFLTLPMIYIAWKRFGWSMIHNWQLWVFLIVSITPLLLWRQWMSQFPEGIPSNAWLLNGNGIRFRPAFFRWIGYERLIKLISGYTGAILLVLGVFHMIKLKHTVLFLSFLISSLLYVTVFASGNVRHDYYQILIMPTVAMFYGLGSYFLLQRFKGKNRMVGIGLVLLITFSSFYFSWMQVKDYFNINNREMIAVGKIADRSLPQDAKVIALYNGDTSFLYQINRQGWPTYQQPIPELIKKGATHLVQLEPSSSDRDLYAHEYEIIEQSPEFVIVKLQ